MHSQPQHRQPAAGGRSFPPHTVPQLAAAALEWVAGGEQHLPGAIAELSKSDRAAVLIAARRLGQILRARCAHTPPASLWWERSSGTPAPTEPQDGAVVRVVRFDGAMVLAERDDWQPTDHADSEGADAIERRWHLRTPEHVTGAPLAWRELVDHAQRLIIFAAVPTAHSVAAGRAGVHIGHGTEGAPTHA